MLILLKQRSKEKKGYTTSVDWWSLGVVMFKLLTGNLPFPKMNVSELVEWGSSKRIISSNMTKKLTGDNGIVQESSNNINFSRKAVSKLKQLSTSFDFGLSDEELDLMPEQYVKFCTSLAEMRRDYGISTSCVSMILGLLEVNEHKRLGDGPSAKCSIKKHDFLKDIQWELLAQKHILAPYEPIPNAVAKRPAFSSFENALTQCGKIHWLNEYPTRMEQKFFKNW